MNRFQANLPSLDALIAIPDRQGRAGCPARSFADRIFFRPGGDVGEFSPSLFLPHPAEFGCAAPAPRAAPDHRWDQWRRCREAIGRNTSLPGFCGVGEICSVGGTIIPDGAMHAAAIALLGQLDLLDAVAGMDEHALTGSDSQILFCRGASFHADFQTWPEKAFLTQYLAGPEMDLVMPLVGWRQTLRPSDIVFFDPAIPHGLIPPGALGGQIPSSVGLSFFVSITVHMTPALRQAFGVRHFERDAQPPSDAPVLWPYPEVDPVTGALTQPVTGRQHRWLKNP